MKLQLAKLREYLDSIVSWSFARRRVFLHALTFCSLLQLWNDIVLLFYNRKAPVRSIFYHQGLRYFDYLMCDVNVVVIISRRILEIVIKEIRRSHRLIYNLIERQIGILFLHVL